MTSFASEMRRLLKHIEHTECYCKSCGQHKHRRQMMKSIPICITCNEARNKRSRMADLARAAAAARMPYQVVRMRVHHGWTPERALSTPVRLKRRAA